MYAFNGFLLFKSVTELFCFVLSSFPFVSSLISAIKEGCASDYGMVNLFVRKRTSILGHMRPATI